MEALVVLAALGFVALSLGGARWRRPDVPALRARAPMLLALLPHSHDDLARWVGVAIGAGACEELLFRGFGLWYLGQWGISALGAVAVTSTLFGLAHLYQGWRGVAFSTVLGVIFAGTYLGVGSLFVPMVLHVAIDLAVGLAWHRALAADGLAARAAAGNVPGTS